MNDIEKLNKRNLFILVIVSSIIILSTVVLLATGVIGGDKRTAEEKLVDAAIYTALSDAKETVVTISVEDLALSGMEGMEAMFIENIIKDLSIKTTISSNDSMERIYMKSDLMMNSLILITMKMYADEKVMAIEVPTLYSQPVYIEWDLVDAFVEALNLNDQVMAFVEAMPTLTEETTEQHKGYIEETKGYLLERDYESIEYMDAPVYYELLTTFLNSLMASEVAIVEEEIDEETVSFSAYELTATGDEIGTFMSDLVDASSMDEKLQETLDIHEETFQQMKGAMDIEDMLASMNLSDIPIPEVDQVMVDSKVYLYEDTYIDHLSTTVSFQVSGLDDLTKGPFTTEILIEVENQMMDSETFIPKELDISQGVNVSRMDQEELFVFGQELMEEMTKNLNEMLGAMGMDLDTLMNQFN